MGLDSDIGDFFAQLPLPIFLIFCGSLLLLVVVIALMVWERRRKAARRLAASTTSASSAAVAQNYSADLPDLDALVTNIPQSAAAQPPARESGVASRLKLTNGEEVEAAEILTVYRDVAEGGLVVQVGSSIYRNPPVDADPEFRKRMMSTLRELSTVLRDAAPPPPASTSAAAPPPIAAAPAPSVTSTAEIPPMPPGALPGDLPKFRMPDNPEPKKRGRRPPAEPIPEINIVEAIEAFLQYRLASAPQFAGRSIHVNPAPGDGIDIEVDGRVFDSVSSVDDEAVRAFLQATIEEWQSRQ